MIIRIVRMTFEKEKTQEFLKLFDHYKKNIRAQPGCTHLELLQDADTPYVFSTYSHWTDEHALNAYRNSDTFGRVWPATKALFSEKPIAHSYRIEQKVST